MSNFIGDALSATKLLPKRDREIEVMLAIPIKIRQGDWAAFLNILRAKDTNYTEYLGIPVLEEIKQVLKSPDLV